MKGDEQSKRRDQWRKIIDEYLKSEMTQKAFCEQRGLSLPQLVYYHGQFKKNKAPAASASFVPVKVSVPDKTSVVSEIKLSLPNGFQCFFQSHTDAGQIKRLVEVLLSC
jgi:hypothetical protein